MIFLDACVIIYWVEIAEPYYGKFVDKLHDIRTQYGLLPFAVSHLSLLECRVKPVREKNKDLLKRYQQFFAAQDLNLVALTPAVLEVATQLRAQHHLPTPDAIQAASALSISDPIIFLTGDSGFKKVPNLNVIKI